MTFDIGDVYTRDWYVFDDAGDLATATVAVTVTLPDGTTSTPSVTNVSTGRYRVSVPCSAAGRWSAAWAGTSVGGVSGKNVADTDTWFVASPYGDLVSLDEMKANLNIDDYDLAYDDELAHFIDVVSVFAEDRIGRTFRRQPVVATLSGGSSRLVLPKFPVLSVTSITENGTTLSASDYALDPDTGFVTRLSGAYTPGAWAAGHRNVVVTYTAGYADPPAQVVHGAMRMVAHLWETQRGTFGPARAGAEDEYIPGTTYSVPRRVLELWEPAPGPQVA